MGYSALSRGTLGDAGVWAGQRGEGGMVKLTKRRGQRIWCSGQQFGPEDQVPPAETIVNSRRPLPVARCKQYLEATLRPGENFWVIAASTREEILAAATLRAQLFYPYPQSDATLTGIEAVKARLANDFLANDLLKSRAKSEFNRESKFEALGGPVIKCLLAVCRKSSLRGATPSSYLTPPSASSSVDMNHGAEPLVAIGTLDIQDGTGVKAAADVNLVTFQLSALALQAQHLRKQVHKGTKKKPAKKFFPIEQEDTFPQAYIFNVCVVKDARRMGVARALMAAALKVAKEMELRVVFVHVEADNRSALALYDSLGYAVEEEEPVEVESLLPRPRRILLSFWLN